MLKFQAIDINTGKTVTGVGYCPSMEESQNYDTTVGYLIKDPTMKWQDCLEFTVDSDFYIVKAESVAVIIERF